MRQLHSVFIDDIKFEFIHYSMLYTKGEIFHNIDCLFHSGGEVHEQWNQLYGNICRSIGIVQELFLKLSVPHLGISGRFRIDQIGTTKGNDIYFVNIRAKKTSLEEI